MLTITNDGQPVPWSAHKGYGRKSFNPRFKEKQFYQWQIRSQFNRENPIRGPVSLHISFYLPIPKATSSIRKKQMLNGMLHHIKRPDTSNLTKFLEDCLKTIVFEDDSQVCEIFAKKLFSEIPKTVIQISELA
jgi:Holliday junction resolvase RusA-like endonuclease